ncbi:hypothetical protein [Lysinibacillus sp. BSL11]
MEEILKLIKEYKEVVVLIISLFGLKSFFTFISSKPLERQLFSKENKIIYELINIITLFILFPTVTLYFFILDHYKIVKIIDNNFGYILFLYFFIFILLNIRKILTIKYIKRFILKLNNKIYNFITHSKVETTIFFLYIVFSWIIFGSLNASIIIENNAIKLKIFILSLFVFIELYFVYVSLFMGTNFKLTKAMMVVIKLENGDIYENYYIYNPSKNFILIGKEKDPNLCKEPILIQINKILSCKQVDTVLEID